MISKHLLIALSVPIVSMTAIAQPNADMMKAAKRPLGIKAGINHHFLSSVRSFNVSNNTGFFIGGYFAPQTSSRFSFRSEILISRQGYDYATNQHTGSVKLDYLMLPQLFTIDLTRFIQLHAGPQMAILLKTRIDSSSSPSSVPNLSKPMEIFSRFHFGYAMGIESNPVVGFVVGVRYNLFLSLFDYQSGQTNTPSYAPNYSGRLKHGTFQASLGYRF